MRYQQRLAMLLCSGPLWIASFGDGVQDSQQEIAFPSSDGLQLEGTLYLPASRPSPAVVLVHGSGPHSREEVLQLVNFGFSIPVFTEISQALVENGIAAFSYDKRTCGKFNNCADNNYPQPDALNVTIEDFIEDALAAVVYLQSRSDIADVVVVGHSQSGQFVPILLERNPSIASGVILAGPFSSIDIVLADQLAFTRQLMLDAGMNESTVDAQLQPVADLLESVEAIRMGNSKDPAGGVSADFWNGWMDLQPAALEAAAAVNQSMLILNGELDTNVFVPEAELWAEYLTKSGANFELVLLPCISHAMNCLNVENGTSLLDLTVDDVGKHVDPSVTDALTDFVLATTEVPDPSTTSGGSCLSSTLAVLATSMLSSTLVGVLSSISTL